MFRPAERKRAKLRLALCGPSGSGKTYSSILIAKGMGEKIAMIDTEHRSGELYADIATYDVSPLGAPYSPERYIQMIVEAEKQGYDVLIIDSLSHAWSGDGGVLEMVDKATRASKVQNSYTAWRYVTPEHNRLVDAMLKANLHIIATIRSKTDYETSKDSDGKMKVTKLGLAPIQREGMDYEFTTVLDISLEGHVASASKDRTRIFDGKFLVPDEETGKALLHWLNEGVDERKRHEEEMAEALQKISEAKTIEELQIYWEGKGGVNVNVKIKEWSTNKMAGEIMKNAKEKRKKELENEIKFQESKKKLEETQRLEKEMYGPDLDQGESQPSC
jgi:hypothetical protein